MEILPVVFAFILVILTIVLSVVGIQIILVLIEVRRSLKKFNDTLDYSQQKINQVLEPLQKLANLSSSIKVGAVVFERFMDWVDNKKKITTEKS